MAQKYKVVVRCYAYIHVEVEAESPADAESLAVEAAASRSLEDLAENNDLELTFEDFRSEVEE